MDPEVIKKFLENGPKADKTICGWVQLFAGPDVGNNRAIDGIPSHGIGIIKDGKLEFFKKVSVKGRYIMTVVCNKIVPVYQKYRDKFGKPKFPDDNISNIDYKGLAKFKF